MRGCADLHKGPRIAPAYGRGDSEIRELKVKTGFVVASSEHARVTRTNSR